MARANLTPAPDGPCSPCYEARANCECAWGCDCPGGRGAMAAGPRDPVVAYELPGMVGHECAEAHPSAPYAWCIRVAGHDGRHVYARVPA